MGDVIDTITGKKQIESQERIARKRIRNEEKLRRDQRIATTREQEASRTAAQASSRLQKAKGKAVTGASLQQKGIARRPIASFADIGRAVLDEGNVS